MVQIDPESITAVVNRLRRAQGQLDALVRSVEGGADCRTVVTQLAAVSKALDRAGYAIIAAAMKDCLAEADGTHPDDGITTAELEDLFLALA